MATNNSNTTSKHFLDSIEEGVINTSTTTNTTTTNTVDPELENKTQLDLEIEDDLTEKEQLALEEEQRLLEQGEDNEEGQEGEDKNKETEESFSYAPFIQELIDSEVLKYDDSLELDDDVNGLKDIVDYTVKAGIEEYKQSFKNPVAKKFLDFIEDGGSPEDFIQGVSQIPDYANYDIKDLDTQKNLIRDSLALQGYDEEEIEETVASFEEINTLEKNATIAQKKLIKFAEIELNKITENQKVEAQKRQENLVKEVETLKENIFNKPDIAGFKPSKAEREKFYDYMTKPVKDEATGKMTTRYFLEMKDEDKIKMAYFNFKKFNFSDIETKVETKKANELQRVLKLKKDNLSGKNTTREQEETTVNKINWLNLKD